MKVGIRRWPLVLMMMVGSIWAPLLWSEIPEGTPRGFSRQVLDNGLEVFLYENHSTPLVYIEIAFRCGGITQDERTAGLFHFYEHLMFKGNSRYPTAAAVQTAYLDLGVSQWNGSTGSEYVNYYFTVPSHMIREGLEFWSFAIREPLLKEEEIEREKGVVISEITGDFSDPDHIFQAAVDKHLFPRYPWRRDPRGTVENVRSCTREDLLRIKNTYYVPNNAALFIGGDIDPVKTLALVKEIYGSWKAAPDPWATALSPQLDKPFQQPLFLVYPDSTVNPRIGVVSIYYRGPDVQRDTTATYGADVWGTLLDNPAGRYKTRLIQANLGIPDPRYTGAWYWTQRDGGQIVFWAYLLRDERPFSQKVRSLYELLSQQEIPAMVQDASYFSAEEFELVKQVLENQQILEQETVEGFLRNLRFWWASASTDYYFSYMKNLRSTTKEAVSRYVQQYLLETAPLITLRIHPSVYEQEKKRLESDGFTVITEDKAFWWK
ncbi:MAG TPA: pitrilysin family protein [Termitinemataceae bacterium]|nr:pitrilysin family protein [Termitinemataceae bacterium]HOM22467.1 pitrilysin family protein [Termitinemataceae bacterium]HPQ01083.1 pitrilysin family protein [Termitinemataceae bacterium]